MEEMEGMGGRGARMCVDSEGDSLFENMKSRHGEWGPGEPSEVVEACKGAPTQDRESFPEAVYFREKGRELR